PHGLPVRARIEMYAVGGAGDEHARHRRSAEQQHGMRRSMPGAWRAVTSNCAPGGVPHAARSYAMIRDITSDDLPAVLALNNAHAVEVNALTADTLAAFVAVATHARVSAGGHGFLIA